MLAYVLLVCLLLRGILASPHGVTKRQTPPAPPAAPAPACAPVHIIAARGSGEAPGAGLIGSLQDLVVQSNPGTTVEAVDYPATIENYNVSSSQGTAALTRQLTAFTQQCPSSQVVLLGYSQGAHIVGDTLCGGGGLPGFGSGPTPTTPPIDPVIGNKVVAIIQMGDPRHIINQAFNVGSSKKNGIFPRNADQLCAAYAAKIQSYCNTGDPFCDLGNDIQVHLGYTREFNSQAQFFTNFAIQKALNPAGAPVPSFEGR